MSKPSPTCPDRWNTSVWARSYFGFPASPPVCPCQWSNRLIQNRAWQVLATNRDLIRTLDELAGLFP